jgi:sortase A
VLRRLAKETGGEAFFPESSRDITSICEGIARDIRNQYTLTYVPTIASQDGSYRAIEVRASAPGRGRLLVRTRTGYSVPVNTPESGSRGRSFLRWVRTLLFIAGALAIFYVVLTLLHAKLYQEAAGSALDQQITAQDQHKVSLSRSVAREGDVLGRIEIPRLGVMVAILEGTTSQTLRLGVGHIEGTALPGEPGNIGIAGHRDTYFRALKDIRTNDEIQIETATGLTRYQVDWTQIVAPGDTEILAPSTISAITLVTCYPFHFIGPAPERFIVHAHKT